MGLRKLHILRRQGSIAKHFDLRTGTKMRIVYAYNIESPLARWWLPSQIFSCHLRHLAPFMTVYGRLRSFHIVRRPRFNFNKTKNILVPADQVDFPSATWRAKIARHHHVSQLPQVEERLFLAVRPDAQVPWPLIGGQHPLSHPIQAMNDRLRDNGREHGRSSSM